MSLLYLTCWNAHTAVSPTMDEVADAPATGRSYRASLKEHRMPLRTPAILQEPVLVEYAQPNIRWVNSPALCFHSLILKLLTD